ncbi:MAG TPA: YbaK/EbsC family protein [Gaiellaceae bacterium]|nr:YbaK/EbsC family protein [Gaiellaceae bacterium]
MSAWPEPVERVAAVLRGAAVDARIEEFTDGAATARDAAKAIGCELSQIVKSLVFVCDGAFVLALVPGDARADERAVAAAADASEARIAGAEEVMFATGFAPGAVAPFPLRAVARTFMDSSLLAHGVVWIGAGTTEHMAAMPPLELQRITRSRAVNLTAQS